MKALEMFVLFLLHGLNLHFVTSSYEKLHSFEVDVDSLEKGVALANQIIAKTRCLYMNEIAIHRTLYNGLGDKENVRLSRRWCNWKKDNQYCAMQREWESTEVDWEEVELWISNEEISFLIYFRVR